MHNHHVEHNAPNIFVANQHQREFAFFSASVLSLLCIYFAMLPSMIEALRSSPNTAYVSALFFCYWLVAALIFLRFSSFSVGSGRWSLLTLRQNFRILCFSTAALIICATVATQILGFTPAKNTHLNTSSTHLVFATLIYIVFVPVQEFIARGVLFGALSKYLDGRWSSWFCIVLSSATYSILHLYLGVLIAGIVFVPGMVWAWLYWRTNSLAVVSISHLTCGLYAIFFLELI